MTNEISAYRRQKLAQIARISIILWTVLLCCCAERTSRLEIEPVRAQSNPIPIVPDDALQKAAAEALGDREGAVIVLDPQNGRLRAVVHDRAAYEQTYPPGSAIKPFTALAALRAGTLERDSKHRCRRRYARDGYEILCSHPVSASPLDLAQALAYSCNDYFANVGERLSEGVFNATLSGFGFGERTGVSAAEAAGELPRGDWSVQAALGDSDRLLVTPIQLAMAYAALVNGGRLNHPQQSSDLNLIAREAGQPNVPPSHRAVLIDGMRGVVKYGTAAKAGLGDLPGYIFGKTGTSTASNGFRTQGWFVGFVAEKGPVGPPAPDRVSLEVLVFLRRAHGSECAAIAKPILELATRGTIASIATPIPAQKTPTPRSSPATGQTVKVFSNRDQLKYELPLEEYLLGVVSSEASIESEPQALQAQAIVSRTYALNNLGRHAADGYDFCSLTHCQQYIAPTKTLRPAFRLAVEKTAGVVLTLASGKRAEVYFHAACGGVTANIEKLWGSPSPAPAHLIGVRDDFCAAAPNRTWSQSIPRDQLLKALRSDERSDVGPRLDAIVVSKRDDTGRAEQITLEGERRRTIRGWDFKIIVGRSLGWQMIKSSMFNVSRAGNAFLFRGGGFGHGLGLCQSGAHVMAKRGMTDRRILDYYFPGLKLSNALSIQPALDSSIAAAPQLIPASFSQKGKTISSERFRLSVPPATDPRLIEQATRTLEAAYADLSQRIERAGVPLQIVAPFEVVIHASTSDFIAATGQPGMAAGATRGRKIQLQPLALLQRRGILYSTVRHELTHAVIEILGRGRTPRWLAEGTCIYVAGEGRRYPRAPGANSVDVAELERRLEKNLSTDKTRDLYSRAYEEVRSILRKEGEGALWKRIAASPSQAGV